MELLFPALMCGIFCYLGAIESAPMFGITGSFYMFAVRSSVACCAASSSVT